MAKLKIRKLLKENELLTKRLNDLSVVLAYVAHNQGGKISVTKKELETLPNAGFTVSNTKGTIELKLDYS